MFLLGTLMQTPFAVWDFVHHVGAMSISGSGVLEFGYLTLQSPVT
ncbi:MAG: hypothetical protein R3E58_09995 [Phycisphaerae bacterium]